MNELSAYALELLQASRDLPLYRARHLASGDHVLIRMMGDTQPSVALNRLQHEYSFAGELDSAWAVRPLAFERNQDRATLLLLEDSGGLPLDRLLGEPLEPTRFLRLAIALTSALQHVHRRGLIHKDIKPAHVMVDAAGTVRLTGFGVASRLPRERLAPALPEVIAGTLAYMAPEQTGRMNRSIDARSDLYSLGVTFYEMLTGTLPFSAMEAIEWIHCHVARRPTPPREHVAGIPEQLETIVLKLLAKNAEQRYQTARGVELDLRKCLASLEAQGSIDPFPLGERDASDRLLMPEKLYARAEETDTLLAAFERVVSEDAAEIVLVSGYAGSGKSSFVNELHRSIVPPRGFFASGKFDQHKRNIPYATLTQALQSLFRQLLVKPEAQLAVWRQALRGALGENGRLMVELIPELALIIGEQPPVVDLAAREQPNRFQRALLQLLGVFARPEHPLALFLDDLQWLDKATIELLERLATEKEVSHLLLIGAYRSNEVAADHPLARSLSVIRGSGVKVTEIQLCPLRAEHVAQLIADALQTEPTRVRLLADLVLEKTDGNPFFVIQFVTSLAEEGLLVFDPERSQWQWDIERVRGRRITENVADLMALKLSRLPASTQEALCSFACLGNVASLPVLSMVHGRSVAEIDLVMWEAVRAGLVLRLDGSYMFVHDRVQEAAYALIPEGARARAHMQIGRVLATRIPEAEIEEGIFDIVNQFNRGVSATDSSEERVQVAQLNLRAARRALGSSAHASALAYLAAGRTLMGEDDWQRHYRLMFDLELASAECEFATGDLSTAERRLPALLARADTEADGAAVVVLHTTVQSHLGSPDRAAEIGLRYLRERGIAWPTHPTSADVREEYVRMRERLGDRPVESLIDLPLMTDPHSLSLMEVMVALIVPTGLYDRNLMHLVMLRIANMSLDHGNTNSSCAAYVHLSHVIGPRFGDVRLGHSFGRLSVDLVDKRGFDRFRTRVYTAYGGFVLPWLRPVREGYELSRRGCELGVARGELTWSSYAWWIRSSTLLDSGEPLPAVQAEAENGLAFTRRAQFQFTIDLVVLALRFARSLRGFTAALGSFEEEGFDEQAYERRLLAAKMSSHVALRYWVRKLQARSFANDYDTALVAAENASPLLGETPASFEHAEFHMHTALALAADFDALEAPEKTRRIQAMLAHEQQLSRWAEDCPQNFENRAALVGAEIARIEGRDLDAQRLYERAIRSAHASGFIHNEALAHEIAARFYAARGFDKFEEAYLREARSCYVRWGADGKVRQLDQLYPRLRYTAHAADPTSTIGETLEYLDLATVIKLSQAVSGEIVLERLIDTLMRTAIEHAGAQRGMLILARGDEYQIVAEAAIDTDTVRVGQLQSGVSLADVPQSLIRYVVRTKESVHLDDAISDRAFADDEYIHRRHARSILCLPCLKDSTLIGMIYLENNLTTHAFTPSRMVLLKFLASEAAISLENIRLYGELQEREAKVRRLVDSNIIGIFTWRFDGRIMDGNEAFLRMVGYDRDDLDSGRLRWTELTPAEWRDADDQRLAELKATGTAQPYEKEYFQKSGGRVPVLVGGASFPGGREEGVAFVIDLTERKRAEMEARESARRYREAEVALAHASRVATLGQMSASIAHEVNQPIAATMTNAQAALRFLAAEPPNLGEVRQALNRIARLSNRVIEVVGRIRALVAKSSPRQDEFQINEAIDEVISLTHGELVKNGVALHREFAARLPLVHADRVQLQQVILNLITNAVEAMSGLREEQRELRISTIAAETEGILVAVRDSGPGLDPANFNRVFDSFYSTKPAGLGMGLSICRSIVEAHGGRLWVEAGKPSGAIFALTLPVNGSRAH